MNFNRQLHSIPTITVTGFLSIFPEHTTSPSCPICSGFLFLSKAIQDHSQNFYGVSPQISAVSLQVPFFCKACLFMQGVNSSCLLMGPTDRYKTFVTPTWQLAFPSTASSSSLVSDLSMPRWQSRFPWSVHIPTLTFDQTPRTAQL